MKPILVAGHICLDIIPDLRNVAGFEPGRLIEAGKATLATGGAVSNTGQSLHILGAPVRLVGKVGNDLFGQGVRQLLESRDPGLGEGLAVSDDATSYTVVINLVGQDRMFLHAPGCNDTFVSADVSDAAIASCGHLHFGYPPLMAWMFANEGAELAALFARAKGAGLSTSLDMSLPDETAPSGRAPWPSILAQTLPFVDCFLPSIEELLFMLDRRRYDAVKGSVLSHLPVSEFERLADRAHEMGARIVGIKAGSRGLFLSDGSSRIWAPCYSVEVSGTTGAGDATIAGFLYGWLQGWELDQAALAGVATGATCCEAADATSGVRPWREIEARIHNGWQALLTEPPRGYHREGGVFRPAV